jgi:uncharacterized protein YehS (DUF1456 family)
MGGHDLRSDRRGKPDNAQQMPVNRHFMNNIIKKQQTVAVLNLLKR